MQANSVGVTRRSVVKTAPWAAPSLVYVGAAPMPAASGSTLPLTADAPVVAINTYNKTGTISITVHGCPGMTVSAQTQMTGPGTAPAPNPQVATLDSNGDCTFVIPMQKDNSGHADITASVTITSDTGETLIVPYIVVWTK